MSPPGADRDGAAADEFVRESFRDIKRALESIQQQLSSFHREYVSLYTFEHERDEGLVNFKAEQLRHDRDVKAIRDEIRDLRIDAEKRETKAEERHEKAQEHVRQARNLRVMVLGIAAATLVALPSALWAVYMLTHH